MNPSLLPLILLASVSFVSPAMGQSSAPSASDIKAAAAYYDQGRERYRDELFEEAAEKFESADESAPSVAALRNSLIARREAGQLAKALTHAALALELYPNDDKLFEIAQALIDEEGAAFGRVHVSCDSACELLLDNRIVHGAAAQWRAIYVEPGSVTIRASWSGERSESETIEVESGSEREVDFYAPPLPEEVKVVVPPPVEEKKEEPQPVKEEVEQRDGWHPSVFWTSFVLTGVSGGVSIGLSLNAKNNPGVDAVTEKCVAGDLNCDEYQQGQMNQTIATVGWGVTAALGVFTITSAILTDWGESSEEDADDGDGWNNDTWSFREGDLSIRPTFAVGDGASLGATGTF